MYSVDLEFIQAIIFLHKLLLEESIFKTTHKLYGHNLLGYSILSSLNFIDVVPARSTCRVTLAAE